MARSVANTAEGKNRGSIPQCHSARCMNFNAADITPPRLSSQVCLGRHIQGSVMCWLMVMLVMGWG